MYLLFNTFLPRSKHLLISWLQSPSAVILEPQKINSVTVSTVCHEVMGPETYQRRKRLKDYIKSQNRKVVFEKEPKRPSRNEEARSLRQEAGGRVTQRSVPAEDGACADGEAQARDACGACADGDAGSGCVWRVR